MSEQTEEWKQNSLKTSRYFDGFSDQDVKRIASIGSIKKYQADSPIVSDTSSGRFLYIMLKGNARVVKNLKRPDEVELDTIPANNSFGDVAFLLHQPRSASVIASEECFVLALDGDKVDRLNVATKCKLYEHLAKGLARRLVANTYSR